VSDDVVGQWRRRAQLTGRQAWTCVCGAISVVRRRACPQCGKKELMLRPLPPRATATAVTISGASVEHLDQVTGRKPAALLELGSNARLACLVADADARTIDGLRGASLRLVVRRLTLALDAEAPIPYGLKAAADVATRITLRKEKESKEP
jgi:hypothetical protein